MAAAAVEEVAVAEEPTGFLGRWSRRKNDALQGKPLEEPVAPLKIVPVRATPASPAALATGSEPASAPATPPTEQSEKLLSLDDVKALTQASDFKPFMAKNVGADVRNAAMKKLFTDPHYNVMDGLDIYISDYSIADPIPESMLRQMVGAKMLKIFDDEVDEDTKALEGSVLTAEEQAPTLAPSEIDVIEAAGDRPLTLAMPADEIPVAVATPEPGVADTPALSAPQEVPPHDNFLADKTGSDPKRDPGGFLAPT